MAPNNGRPLPWHDTATCEDPDCLGPMVPAGAGERCGPDGRIMCAACGHGRIGSPADVAKVERASHAWHLYETGAIHTDRGCTRCGGVLPIARERLCARCVEKDNAERQGSLFA